MYVTVYKRSMFYYLYFELDGDTYTKFFIFAKGIIIFCFV